MYPRVTAIVVAHNGADHLRRTLAALRSQTRPPDVIIAVDCASTDTSAAILTEFSPTQLVSASEHLPFGAAIGHARRVSASPESENEWLWLLAQDSAPEEGALAALLAAVEVAPSVAVAGPKQMEWTDTSHIREFGETITRLGSTIALVQNELDQAQHDVSSDVLAVGAGGMFVRHTLWDELNGFDPGLPVVDDALDFCIRTRLAGHRIVLVPEARVTSAGDGVAGPSGSRRGSARRKRLRLRRRAQLHRRLAYAPAWALPLHWLSLLPLAILRSLIQLLRKQPGAIPGEFAAAVGSAFAGIRVFRARHNLGRVKKVSWSAIAPLRMSFSQSRRRNALERDAVRVRRDGERREAEFFSGGGAWTVLAMAVIGLALFAPVIGAKFIGGGALLPLSATPAQLWQHMGAADPFTSVLAVLGSLTFWSPSFVLVLIYLAALPLAALGAWFLAARFTQRAGLRAFAAVLWALAPSLLVALSDGRPAAILAHLLLPWLFYAGFRARRSWSAAATTALLAAATLACAPSLAPALFVVWVVCLLSSGRWVARLIAIPLPAIALFGPLVFSQGVERAQWFALLADPGVPLFGTATPPWQLVAGIPGDGLAGWSGFLATFGLGTQALTLVGALLAPLAVLAVLALFLRGSLRAAAALVIGLLGLATGIFANTVAVSFIGSSAVPVWPGAGLSLLWLGLIVAAIIGLGALGRFSPAPAVVCVVALAVAIAPLAIALPTGYSAVTATSGRTLPAVVTAESLTSPRLGTLVLTPVADGSLTVHLERGAGDTLDAQSTLANTQNTATADDARLAVLGVNLVSQSVFVAADELDDLGIGFVLLKPSTSTTDVSSRATLALDGNSLLTSVGDTGYGQLWSHQLDDGAPTTGTPPAAVGSAGSIVLLVQGVVIAIMLLLAMPTGAVRDRDIRSMNPKIKRRGKKRQASAAGDAGVSAGGAGAPGATSPIVAERFVAERSDAAAEAAAAADAQGSHAAVKSAVAGSPDSRMPESVSEGSGHVR